MSVRDSAGVEIVENSALGAWSSGSAWMVADTPVVSIGGDDGDSTTLFSRVQNVVRLADGRIVVTDFGSRQLRFYAADGRFIKSTGRPGAGPGEFNWLGAARRTDGDSLIVWDQDNGRLSVFDSAGRLARTVSIRSEEGAGFPGPMGRASDGSFIGQAYAPSFDVGLVRTQSYFVRYGPDLRPIDTLAERPGVERFIAECGPDTQCAYRSPFTRPLSAAFFRDRLHVGTGESFEISVIGIDGRLLRSIRLGVPNRDVTAADVDRQRAAFFAEARDREGRVQRERVFAQMKIPETMPAYQALRVDRLGNLWVENYRASDDEPPRWAVFDSTGRLLGTLATPRSLRLDDIGDDYVLGVFRDSLDVEHVRMHRLVKTPRR